MIVIDGSEGEGGGQVIRTALTLSAITKKPVEIINIRANRPNPGLQMQHLTAAKAVRSVCRGTLKGAELDSSSLSFEPAGIVGGRYEFDIGTAGSTTLVAQTLIPILLAAEKPSAVKIIGGTHVIKSPSYDYFENVFMPAINHFGISIISKMVAPGYYPKGGGKIEIEIQPCRVNGCSQWPKDDKVQSVIRLSGLPESIAIREKKIFVQNGHEENFVRQDNALSVGNAITCWKGLCGAYVLGEKGKRAEQVAQEALDALNVETRDVDRHLADQLLIYAALASGRTSYMTSEVTDHLKTNASVISRFVGRKIRVENGLIEVS